MCIYLFDILFSFPLSVYPEVESLGHMLDYFLYFLRNSHCGSMRSAMSLQYQDAGLIPDLAQWVKGSGIAIAEL